MKTNDQIIRHIFNCRFSEDDWQLVLNYCHENGIKGVHRALSPKSESTYGQFIQWAAEGFGVGDVVRDSDTFYVVGDELPERMYAIAQIKNGILMVGDVELDKNYIESATAEESEGIYKIIKANGVSLNVSLARFSKPFTPKKWEKVAVEQDGKIRYGIVRECDASDISFAFLVDESGLKQNETLSFHSVTMRSIKRGELERMNQILMVNGVKWNQKAKCLDLNCPRADVGKTYWYISDVFSVRNGKERNTTIDRMRYQNGNYFLKHEDALKLLVEIQKLRGEMLASGE